MSDPCLGELKLTSFPFAPQGWAFCNGQLLSIAQNTALFSLLGTQYGGDGVRTFALPNLQGSVPLGMSPSVSQGQRGGQASVQLSVAQMPPHTHTVSVSSASGTQASPANGVWAQDSGGNAMFAGSSNTALSPSAIGNAGSSLPHDNMQPSLTLNWIIAIHGVFPSRN